MTSTTRLSSQHDPKHVKPTKRTAQGGAKPAKPTKWGAQLLVKMEALRKALAAQS
jgi:hypothetical protein